MNEPQTEKKKNGRWLIPFMVIVLLVVVGTIAGSLLVDRRPAPELPVAASGTDEARDIPSPSAEEQARPSSTNPSPNGPIAVPTGIHVGETAPGFTLKDFNGKSVSLSDYRGKVVIIDFWASWCAPCRSSMPGLKGLHKLKDNGYDDVIGLWESASASQNVARLYGVSGIPHTLVLDRYGIIRFVGHPLQLTRAVIESLL
jgi:thiol-disulfide isomerase/thioredoxin